MARGPAEEPRSTSTTAGNCRTKPIESRRAASHACRARRTRSRRAACVHAVHAAHAAGAHLRSQRTFLLMLHTSATGRCVPRGSRNTQSYIADTTAGRGRPSSACSVPSVSSTTRHAHAPGSSRPGARAIASTVSAPSRQHAESMSARQAARGQCLRRCSCLCLG